MSKTSLKIEQFREGDEQKFLISAPKEIQLILQAIAQKKSNAMLYINDGEHIIKTVFLAANERGIWLDVGPSDEDNASVLLCDSITLVTMHQGAKVQFFCHQMELAMYASHPAFFCPLPAKMVRLQRREYFRLLIPADVPLKCVIPPKTDKPIRPNEITIMDLSVGGIALVCKEQGVHLEEGEIYPDCQIDLPGIGMLTATLQVKNLFDITSPTGHITKHAGCEFVHPDGPTGMLLQRFVALMQSKNSSIK